MQGTAQAARTAGYNPAIDGLRALAVASVFLFHLDRTLLPGGFVGVDVFFVISGFLITRMLAGQGGASPMPLLRFYQNRVARIAPAALLAIAGTLLAGWLVYDEPDFAYLGSAVVFAATSLLNFEYLAHGSYFQATASTQPLLHYWSLAVEEQFYLIYPPLLLLARRLGLDLRCVVAGAGLLSLMLCWALALSHPEAGFYLLPARMWELLAGGWLALKIPAQRDPAELSAAGALRPLGPVALIMLAASFVLVSEARAFPGWQALLPVGATLALLACVSVEGRLARALANPLLVWIGRRSYALYLWHWPVFCLTDYGLYFIPETERLPIKIATSLALAALSFRLIEQPLRQSLRAPRLRVAVLAGYAALVLALAAGGWMARYHSQPDGADGGLVNGGFLYNPSGKLRITALGDSQQVSYASALGEAAERQGWRLRSLGASGTNELPGEPESRWPLVQASLTSERPAIVIIAQDWSEKLGDGASLDAALAWLQAHRIKAIVMLRAPLGMSEDGLAVRIKLGAPRQQDPQGLATRLDCNTRIRAIAARRGATVIDPAPLFLDAQGRIRVVSNGWRPDFHDTEHLSTQGARRVIPLISATVTQLQSSRY